MYCKNCGKQIDDDSRFCSFCGNTLIPAISSNTVPTTYQTLANRKNHFFQPNLLVAGIVVSIIIDIISATLGNLIEKMDNNDTSGSSILNQIYLLIGISVFIRVISTIVIKSLAKRVNRETFTYQLLGFLLPGATFIYLSTIKRLK